VLGREAVVDGDAERWAGGGEPVEEAVVLRRVGGLRHEAAPVNVHDDGQLLAGVVFVVGGGRQVEADGVVAERHVLGLDVRLRVEARADRRRHQETLDAAALVHPEQRAKLADHLVVLWGRHSGGGVGGRRHGCGLGSKARTACYKYSLGRWTRHI
jgi:hypothetical protein